MRAVVKDFSTNKFLFRNTIGRFLVWRERKAYRKLRGIRGVPSLYRIIDGLALVLEEIPGRSLKSLERGTQVPDMFIEALKDLIDKIHLRGVVHCDLKKTPNILLGDDGLPYIVDWGASISRREFRFFPLNLVYRRFISDDYLAITKLKLRRCIALVTPEETERYNERSRGERFVRIIRDKLREVLQRIA